MLFFPFRELPKVALNLASSTLWGFFPVCLIIPKYAMSEPIYKNKVHIPVIIVFIIIQFFILDIFSALFLQFAEAKLKKESSTSNFFYQYGLYKPISYKAPDHFAFVVVSNIEGKTIETYYLKTGKSITVTYQDGSWLHSAEMDYSIMIYCIIPFVGIVMLFLSVVSKIIRTEAFTRNALEKHHDNTFEKICILYGVPFLLSGILFGWMGRVG